MQSTLVLFIGAPDGETTHITISADAFAAAVRDCSGSELDAASCIAEDTLGCTDYRLIEGEDEQVECDDCGGYGHQGQDEVGCFYACYACGTSGWVTKLAAAEREAEREFERARFAAMFKPAPVPQSAKYVPAFEFGDDEIPF